MKKILVLALLIYHSFAGAAQENESLNKLHDEANQLMKDYRFARAREVYEKLLNLEPDNPIYNYETGVCIFKGSINKAAAIPYFEKSIDFRDKSTPPELFYYAGRAYQSDHNFLNAIAAYTTFLNYVGNSAQGKELREEVERLIDQSEKGRVQIEEASYMLFDRSDPNDKNTSKYFMDESRYVELLNLGELVNSRYSEYGPLLISDNNTLVFTSRREGSTGGKLYYDDEYYEDIYVSLNQEGQWQAPVKVEASGLFDGKLMNTPRHDATVAISPDGQTFYTYFNNHIQETKQVNGSWQATKELTQSFSASGSQVSSIFLSPGGKRIFLVSNKNGGLGGRDIYYSDKKEDGTWGDMVNLGPEINTAVDESSPFLPNDSTLYFSSQGHSSVGGYDIFISRLRDGQWTEPENLNIPLNTPFNEIDYRISPDRSFAYYASDRSEGYGKFDIYIIKQGYEAELDSAVIEEMIKSAAENGETLTKEDILRMSQEERSAYSSTTGLVYIGGKAQSQEEIVYEEDKGEVTIAIQDQAFSNEAITEESKIAISKFDESKFQASLAEKAQKDEYGTFYFEERAHFAFDKSYLTEYSANRINKVVEFINQYPDKEFVLRLAGHTDSKGNEAYNLKLSEKRAQAVKDFLLEKGVTNKIGVDYFGESRPVISEETEDNSIFNRRVQVRVYEKGKL